jgi:hypothetical protein
MLDGKDRSVTRVVFFWSHKMKILGVLCSKWFVLQALNLLFEESGQTMFNQIQIARA